MALGEANESVQELGLGTIEEGSSSSSSSSKVAFEESS